jgi:hypothetical protein
MRVLRIVLLGTIGIALLAQASPTSAATDVMPPSLKVPPYAKFLVGQQLSTNELGQVEEQIRWKAEDEPGGTGLQRVRVYERFTEDNAYRARLVYEGLGDRITATGVSNAIETCTSYLQRSYEVRARDWAGNVSTANTATVPRIVDEDGIYLDWYFGGTRQFSVWRNGTWDVSNSNGWIGGTTAKTSEAGAFVTYRRVYAEGQHVGVVMPKGPDRGKADVYVDGVQQAVVDTYSPLVTRRIAMFQTRMSAGLHTIKIVNQATGGHPRIDIDAIVYNTYESQGC